MYDDTITLFNYHKKMGLWYPSVISGVDVKEMCNNATSTTGLNNGDNAELLIKCTSDKIIVCKDGTEKRYTKAKEYQKSNNPVNLITFDIEQDFFFVGEWDDLTPISDDDGFDSGIYHQLNEELDGVYKVTSASHFSLIPHFEIGGK